MSVCPASPGRKAHQILSRELAKRGFDICHSFRPEWYNESIAIDGVEILFPLAQDRYCSEAFLVGNTKHLWPRFVAWAATRSKLDDPLDVYTREAIEEVVHQHAFRFDSSIPTKADTEQISKYEIFWAFEFGAGRLVSMQRIAQVAGLCYLDDATNMAVHPDFGPWISFRAAILFYDGEPKAPPNRPPPIPNLLDASEEERAREKVRKALEPATQPDQVSDLLIASRDCVSIGRDHRFSQPQLLYHYTGDPQYLRT